VIIKKNNDGMFDILHTKDFNPNSKDHLIYLQGLHRSLLSTNLIALCKNFYAQQSNNISSQTAGYNDEAALVHEKKEIFECNNCLTRYDKDYGDCVNGIHKQVEFTTLTEYYCPVCGSPKSEFSLIQ
jgi:rubredoxin